MNRQEREDLIIKLYNKNKTRNFIAKKAKVAFTTINEVIAKNEETQAFKLFAKGLLPHEIKIELGILSTDADKHYLAFRKSLGLFDLSNIYNELGDALPDFVTFYTSAKSYNITPSDMNRSLQLALNTSYLEQENSNAVVKLQETRNAQKIETTNLLKVRKQNRIDLQTNASEAQKAQKIRAEIDLLRSVLHKIKNSNEYLGLKELINETVNSISSQQYFALEVCIIAIMKLVQKNPSLIPLLLFPVPDDHDSTAQSSFYRSVLVKLVTKANELMPNVLEELADLTGKKVLPEIQNLEHLFDSKSDSHDQSSLITSSMNQSESCIVAKDNSEISKPISSFQNEKVVASIVSSILTIMRVTL